MEFDVIILAGGKSRRMGRDKAGIELAGKTLLEHSVDNAHSWGAKRVLVAGPRRDWLKADYVPDPPGHEPSSLLGIYAGLQASDEPWKLVLGCDMPFVKLDLVKLLWAAKNMGGAVAMWQNRLQPLPGLYSHDAMEIIREMLAENQFHLAALLDYLKPTVVSRDAVAMIDPAGVSFFNINSPDELDLALEMERHR